jgi:hypothetical protein
MADLADCNQLLKETSNKEEVKMLKDEELISILGQFEPSISKEAIDEWIRYSYAPSAAQLERIFETEFRLLAWRSQQDFGDRIGFDCANIKILQSRIVNMRLIALIMDSEPSFKQLIDYEDKINREHYMQQRSAGVSREDAMLGLMPYETRCEIVYDFINGYLQGINSELSGILQLSLKTFCNNIIYSKKKLLNRILSARLFQNVGLTVKRQSLNRFARSYHLNAEQVVSFIYKQAVRQSSGNRC